MKHTTTIQQIMPFMRNYGLFIISLAVLIEGEIAIITAGILCLRGTLALNETLIVIVVAAFLSDQIWFYSGRLYGQKLLKNFLFY